MKNSIQLILKRTLANWRLLSAVIIGSILAGSIMSASVIYFESLRDIALQKELADQSPPDLDILLEIDQVPVNFETHGEVVNTVSDMVINRVGKFTSTNERAMRTWTFFVDEPPEYVLMGQCPCRPTVAEPDAVNAFGEGMVECDCRRIQCMTVPDHVDNIEIIYGRHPEVVTEPDAEGNLIVEGVLDENAAEVFGLEVGDVIPARPHWEEFHHTASIRVSGIYRRFNPSEPHWRIFDQAFGSRSDTLDFAQFVLPERTVLEGLGTYFPNMGAEYAWFLDVEPEAIHATDTQLIRNTLTLTETELKSMVDGFVLDTELDKTLLRFEVELFFNRLPMFIVLILIVLVVIYYTATLAGLLIEAQTADVALLRSRGSTSRQLLAMFFIESILLAGFAVAVGPFLALFGVSAIGIIPFYSDLNGGEALPVNLTANVYVMAGIGAVLIMLALFVPAIKVTRQGVLAERAGRARPQRLAFIQRYYLDLGFLGLVLFLFWQLTRQGSFVAIDIFGEAAVNQVILAVPAVFLVAAGVVLLRLFPIAMDLLGRLLANDLVSRFVPPAVVLGIWQMARNPAHHSRISLLLILTAGLGVFAASFAATLERSAREQVLYETGSDIRVSSVAPRSGGRSFNVGAEVGEIDGVAESSPVYRLRGSLVSGFDYDQFSVLAVEPDSIADVAWHREDFSASSYDEAFEAIEYTAESGITLPKDARWLTARVKPLFPMQNVHFFARMSDANGRYFSLRLGSLFPEGEQRLRFNCPLEYANPEEDEFPLPTWCRIGTSLQPQSYGREPGLLPSNPLTLHAIGVASFETGLNSGALDIDDVATLNNTGTELTIIEAFEDSSKQRWFQMRPTIESFADTFTSSPLPAEEAQSPGIMRLRWSSGIPNEFRGVTRGGTIENIPVLASTRLIEELETSIGETIQANIDNERTTLTIAGEIDYFPTLNPDTSRFVIVDYETIHALMNTRRFTGERQPNEVWIATTSGVPTSAELEEFKDESGSGLLRYAATSRVDRELGGLRLRSGPVDDRLTRLAAVSVDPLVSEGWRALLGVAFVTVLIVSAVGFLVHTRVSFKARLASFALLRTIGLSMRQLLLLALLEQAVVVGVAIGIGIYMGTRLGDTIIPYLASSGQDATVVPPMTLEIYWTGFATTFGLLGIVFAVVITISLISVYRMAIHRVMRMGEA